MDNIKSILSRLFVLKKHKSKVVRTQADKLMLRIQASNCLTINKYDNVDLVIKNYENH